MSSAHEQHAERRSFRATRVRWAFLTSAGSKGLGLLVQFLALPLAIRTLGPERFGLYTMLYAALVWIDLGRLGIGPGLTRELAVAWNRGERGREQALFSSAMCLLLAISLVISAAVALGVYFGGSHLDWLFGPSASKFGSELLAGVIVVSAFLIAHIAFSAGEAARSAYQDDFINNLTNMFANFVSLILIFAVAIYFPTIPAFAVAVFGSMVLAKGLNLALLISWSKTYLWPRWRFVDRRELRLLMNSSLAFFAVQIATLLMHNISLFQLGRVVGPEELTPFASVFRLTQLLATGVMMVSMPLWPAITDAAVRGDRDWIVRSYRRLIFGAVAFSTAVALTLTVLGPVLIPLWVGKEVVPDMTLTGLLGFYFVIWMWSHCHAVVLFGLGQLWRVAVVMVVEGVLVLTFAYALMPHFGAVGTALGMCAAALVTSTWLMPLMVRRSLAQPLDAHVADAAPNAATLEEHAL